MFEFRFQLVDDTCRILGIILGVKSHGNLDDRISAGAWHSPSRYLDHAIDFLLVDHAILVVIVRSKDVFELLLQTTRRRQSEANEKFSLI